MPSQAAIRIAKGLRAHADARPVIPCLISSSDSANRNDRIRHVGTTANRELADSGWQSGRSEGKFSRPTRAIRGHDICDGRVSVKRLKKSRPTLHALRIDSDPLFDESPLSLPSEGRSQNLLDSAKKLSCGLYILELG